MILWTGAMLEDQTPYMTKKAVGRLLRSLICTESYTVEAPSCVEVVSWRKDETDYFGVINEQENYPFIPVDNISITVKKKITRTIDLCSGDELYTEYDGKGNTRIRIPKLSVFLIIKTEDAGESGQSQE